MYTELRNYLWDFNTVEYLADLEVAIYRRFPEISEIRNKFNMLYRSIINACYDDEYLDAAVSDFKNIINSSDQFYSKLVSFREV